MGPDSLVLGTRGLWTTNVELLFSGGMFSEMGGGPWDSNSAETEEYVLASLLCEHCQLVCVKKAPVPIPIGWKQRTIR